MDSSLMQCELFDGPEHDTLSGKTSLEPSVLTPAETLRLWLERWLGYALTYRTVDGETPEFCSGRPDWSSGPYWMRNGSEFRNGAVASSLSEILETGPIDRRYFLTPKACRGILRRADKRGKTLPAALQRALTAVADSEQILTSGGGCSLTLLGKANSSHAADKETYVVASTGETSHCLNAGGMGRIDYETETMVIGSLTTKHTPNGHGMSGVNIDEASAGQLIPVAFNYKASAHQSMNPDVVTPSMDIGKSDGLCVAFSCKDSGADVGELSPTLRAMEFDGSHANGGGQVAIAFEPRFVRNGRGAPDEIVSPLKARSGEDGRWDAATCIATESAVRRLTPLECERLQGFPDRHTDIGRADGPRYKALGNSMAVPVIRWIGERIAAHYPAELSKRKI